MKEQALLLSLVGIGMLGVACQWLAWWLRLPVILFLLLAGILIGPVGGILDPDQLLGPLLFPVVSLSVAIILFEGSLTLRIAQIRDMASVVRNLVTVGALLTWILMCLTCHFLIGLPLEFSLLFGAIAVVTGPTVIMPILRTVRPNRKISEVLRWEGILIDPIGALLAVVVFDFIISSRSAPGTVLFAFSRILVIGSAMGVSTALLTGWILRRRLIPEYLQSTFVLMMVVSLFAVSNQAEHESGLLAVTLMGVTLANMRNIELEDILAFKEHVSLILLSVLFILLAARIDPAQFPQLDWKALLLVSLCSFPIRAICIQFCTLGSNLNMRERALLSWIAPRGIVATAVSAAFALRLEEIDYPYAEWLVPLTLGLVIVTVVTQGFSAGPLARWLKVTEPAPNGVLFIGANRVARMIGKALQQQQLPVMLTDSSWDNVKLARMEGLPVYYGSILSQDAEENLDLSGLGKLFAMSGRPHLNALTALRLRREFGADNLYELLSAQDNPRPKHQVSGRHRGNLLFGEQIDFEVMVRRLQAGAQIRATLLSDTFDYQAYRERYAAGCIPLFAIDSAQKLHVYSAEGQELNPGAGWTVISLINSPEEAKNAG